jgi:AcrR family transcriptional regulator
MRSSKGATVAADADVPMSRLERRKQRTRSSLIRAAQTFIAAGQTNVAILEITQAADVGMGSFYNHFQSKDELFEAAVTDVLDSHGALLAELTVAIEDPAETFACSFRLTGRLFRRRPQESQIMLSNAATLLFAERGLAPRARQDIVDGVAAGRFHVDDPDRAVAVAGGALLGLGVLLREHPERNDAEEADVVTKDVLRLFGMTAREAKRLCERPLPDLDAVTVPNSAA